jgi:hypothetical protein
VTRLRRFADVGPLRSQFDQARCGGKVGDELLHPRVRLQPSEHVLRSHTRFRPGKKARHPNERILTLVPPKVRGKNADDPVPDAPDEDFLSERRGVAAVALLPEPV